MTDAGLKQTVVYVSDYNGAKIVAFRAADGAFVSEFGVRGSKDGQLDQPSALTSNGSGVLWVNDWGNDRIQAFSTGGAFLAKLVDPDGAGGYGHAVDLAADSGGTVWATYSTQGTQGVLQLSGADLHLLLKTPVAAGSAAGQLTGGSPSSIAIAVQRDRGTGARTLWLANPNGYRVLRFGVGPSPGDTPSAIDSWPAKGDEAFAYEPNVVRLASGVFHVIGATAGYHVSTWGIKVVKRTTATWTGTWTTNWGAFTVKLSGKKATGTYTHDGGRITGTVSGRTLTGTWSESPTYKGPKDAGSFTITMSADGKSFKGTWKFADGTLGRDRIWSGTR